MEPPGDETEKNERQFFIDAIDLGPVDPKSATAYYGLGMKLSEGETIQLGDGTIMDSRQLFLKGIEVDPTFAPSYYGLGRELSEGETIDLGRGIATNRRQLFLKAIEVEPTFSAPYYDLGAQLSGNEIITLNDGITKMNNVKLFVKAMDLDPSCRDFFVRSHLEGIARNRPHRSSFVRSHLEGIARHRSSFMYIPAVSRVILYVSQLLAFCVWFPLFLSLYFSVPFSSSIFTGFSLFYVLCSHLFYASLWLPPPPPPPSLP